MAFDMLYGDLAVVLVLFNVITIYSPIHMFSSPRVSGYCIRCHDGITTQRRLLGLGRQVIPAIP